MSAILLTKLDIDVLVQVAWLGPSEAQHWIPMTDDPNAFGALLWSRNYEWAGRPADGPLPAYIFTPLPIAVTAIEGVKQCDYYEYQTMSQEQRWKRGGLGEQLQTLRERLLYEVPELLVAPWGWTGRDLLQRADRPAPALPVAPPADPRIDAFFDTWAAIDLQLVDTGLTDSIHSKVADPRNLVAAGYHRPAGHSGVAPVRVVLCADEATATELFNAEVLEQQNQRFQNDVHVYRWGTTVVTTFFLPAHEADHIGSVDAKVGRLGAPDDQWWSLAPPIQELAGEVLASRVRLSRARAGTHSDARAVVARTPTEIEELAAMVEDDEVRALLATVNTRKQTAILLRGVSEVGSVLTGGIVEEIQVVSGIPRMVHRLFLNTEGASMSIATLVLVDKLTQTPAIATVKDPLVGRTMIAQKPR